MTRRVTGALFPIVLAAVMATVGCARARGASPAPHVSPLEDSSTSTDLEQRDLPVTAKDLDILDHTDAILSDPAKWNRHDDRVCTPEDTTWSLFCALQRASVEVLGNYDHRRAALQEVRFAIEAAAPDHEFEHRLRDYNNLATTRFEDIKAVIHVARLRVADRLAAAQR